MLRRRSLQTAGAICGVALALAAACRDRREPPDQLSPAPFLDSNALKDHALVTLGREVRSVLPAACPSDIELPLGGARRLELAFGAAGSPAGGEARFRALLKTVDGEETVALDESLSVEAGARTTWVAREIAVPAGARTLRLEARGTSRTTFWRPVLSLRGGPPRPNVIVVSLDTVRADHLNAYGYKRRPTSPEFDAWAAQGTLLENAMGAAPGTLSSQMALLTGKYPSNHGVTYANWRRSGKMPVLAPEISTLAESLGRGGFLTAAFTGAGYFALPVGYSRGFLEFVSSTDETLGGAATVFDKALSWIEDHKDDPFFLFVHTYEAHEPYLDKRFVRQEGLGEEDWKTRNEALYDGDIRHADEYLGKLRQRLQDLSLAERTLVVIVSDHGEEFGDHFDVWNDGHGHSLYDEQVHVPFVVVGPSILRGRRLTEAVDLTAVAPTILAFLGIAPPADLDGRDLLRLLRGESGHKGEEEWLAFSEDVWIGPATYAARGAGWKLIVQGEGLPERFLDNDRRRAIWSAVERLDPEMLFHLSSDARERENRLGREGAGVSSIRTRLRTHLTGLARGEADHGRSAIALDAEALERLRALGYVE